MRPDEADIVTLVGVRLIRHGKTILDGLDWRVRPGERWVMLGPNGSGKTCLCQIISFYLHPSAGSVSVLGGELGHVDVCRAEIGSLPEHRRRVAQGHGGEIVELVP